MRSSRAVWEFNTSVKNKCKLKRAASLKLIVNYIAFFVLLTTISCKKNISEPNNSPLRSLDVKSKDFSLNKHAKTIKGTYGVLTTDQRFETTDIIQLQSGVLMAILGNSFDNPNKTFVFKSYSYNNGVTWTSPQDLKLPFTGYKFTFCNLFKVRSRLYLVLNRVAGCKGTIEGGIPAICHSDDEGATWSKPRLLLRGREREIVIINSRNITVTKTGRIIIPVRYGQFGTSPFRVNVIYSDNNCRNWVESPNSFTGVNTTEAKFVEPSIGQLKDGRLIMLIRTALGHIYKSYSSDNGTTWSVPESTPLVSPWTAHSIRITKHGYIVIAYTNSISASDPGYPRNNLKFAVSYDNGETWKPAGTIFEIPESHVEFLMEPNITFLNNDKYLVTFYRQLNTTSHRIETAIFSKQAILRDEENWDDLQWWSTSGAGTISILNNRLHLGSNPNSITSVYKSQILSGSYAFEFRAKVNSFVRPGYVDEYSTLGLKITDGSYKLLFKLESDGFYINDNTNAWIRHAVPMYSNNKYDWHLWRVEVTDGKAKVFMDGLNVIKEYNLAGAAEEAEGISYSTYCNLNTQTDSYIDYAYYDPL